MIKSLWLAETVRLVEKESGSFADQEANRQARSCQGSLAQRIVVRAEILAKQNGLLSAQQILINSIKVSLVILLIVAMIMGATLAVGTLSQDPINLYLALFSLLGVHLVTLLIWLFSSFCLASGSGSVFIYCWLWLAQKFSQKQTIKQLIPAFITLFGYRIRWLIGFIVNLLWTVLLCSALIILILLFSTKHYSFEWKTTLLSADNVIAITHYLGALPAMLGFPMPNDTMIRLSEQAVNASDVRSAWAIWLLGIFVVYGVMVRFLLMLFCGLKWYQSCRHMQFDLNHPDYQILATKLQPITRQIIDEDSALTVSPIIGKSTSTPSHQAAFLVAIDIVEDWQPPEQIAFLGFLNTHEQRQRILDYLQSSPAQKLLIAIDTDRTPDRGMTNLIHQLMTKSQQTAIWFINSGKQIKNWQALSLPFADPTWLIEEK
ncbi:DUF2868 domain-containing protein [Orbaceae bacterium ESL0727]|nr:DUF2868 domain-containing protein [Orbaceae bacterium ESL0727]